MAGRMATLQGEGVGLDGLRAVSGASGNRKIYWEKQGNDRMCALHCTNSLLQGPLLSESDMAAKAIELDAKERRLLLEGTSDGHQYSLQQSENVAVDGFFNFTVMEECLKTFNILCIRSTNPAVSHLMTNPHRRRRDCSVILKVSPPRTLHSFYLSLPLVRLFSAIDLIKRSQEGFIVHSHQHWFAIRKVFGAWYNLDSLRAAPLKLSSLELSSFLGNLQGKAEMTIFIVALDDDGRGGRLPDPNPSEASRSRLKADIQFYLSDDQMEEMHKRARLKEAADAKKAEETGDDDESSSSGRCYLVKAPPGKSLEPHQWPPESQGFRLSDEGVGRQSSGEVGNSGVGGGDFGADEAEEEDPELREAIAASLASFKSQLPSPPAEPEPLDPDTHRLQIRLPNGANLKRRFHTSAPIKDIFQWVEYETARDEHSGCISGDPLPLRRCYSFLTQYPKRKILKAQDGFVELLDDQSTGGENISCHSLKQMGFAKQELLILHL